MTDDDWQQMLAVLEVMKAGLVASDFSTKEESGSHINLPRPTSVLSDGAQKLLESVDDGGVPLYVTDHLKRIAEENGFEVSEQDTPNTIIEALRALDE